MSKKCKCNIISFGHLNLYILLIPLGTILLSSIEVILFNSKKLSVEATNKERHPIIITINYALGLCLSFICFIIHKIYSKRNKPTKIFFLEKMMNKSTFNSKITIKVKFLWILLGSLLDFIANVIYNNIPIDSEDFLVFWPTNILLMSSFAYFLLKMKLYKHHYLSICVIIIIGLAYNFISENLNLNKLKINYIWHICNLFSESIFNVLYVLYKYYMFIKYINLYTMLFVQGLLELLFGIISLIITTKYFEKFDSFSTYIEGLDGTEIGIFIGLIFVHFLSYLTINLIIDIFTPFHIFLIDILSQIIIFHIDKEIDSKIGITIACLIFLILCVLMSLIFIEIIQLNFCGLSTMTKKNIEERAKLDSILNIYHDDEDINKEDKGKDEEEKEITLKGYSFELRDFSINQINPILPSELDSIEENI